VDDLEIVGKPVKRVDGRSKVTGETLFTTDLKLPGMLFGKALRSPCPHAKIVNIDTSRAARLPGVKAVVTGKDFMFTYGRSVQDQPFFCWDKVRYVGDPVAGVAAVDEDTAEEALYLIRVDYEELSPVLDVYKAMEVGSPLVHEKMMEYPRSPSVQPVPQTNICAHVKMRKGNIEQGFKEADHVFEDTFHTAAVQHCHLEPHVSVAQADSSGKITIWTASQKPFDLRRGLATSLGIPSNQIRVIVPELGGGFGGKVWVRSEAISVALALKVKQNRPVKATLTREEEFSATSGVKHPAHIKVKTGTTRDGRIVARKVESIYDTGAYADSGPGVAAYGAFVSPGPYEVPHVWTDSYTVYTNKMVATSWRSLGSAQMMFAIESQMDIIADSLGIDPVELRLKNLVHEGSFTVTGQQLKKTGIRECLLKVKEAMKWDSNDKTTNRGKGIALLQHLSILPASSSAAVAINEDGTAKVICSNIEMGQGSETVMTQIAAETLGMNLGDIRITLPDTDVTPFDVGATSSKQTFYMGKAIQLAAQDARQKLLTVASDKLEANPDDLEIRGGWIWVKGSPDKKIPIKKLPLGADGVPIVGHGAFQTEDAVPADSETGYSPNPIGFWMFAAQGIEVEVDRETGRVRILRVVSAHDVGKAINPFNCEQQIEGGIGMGVGISLMEEIKTQNGKTINPNFVDYKMPTAMDLPAEIVPILVEVPEEDGPFGARGLGEPATGATAPATANAIFRAVGVRVKEIPMTPDKILRALTLKETQK
jgi:CO/xanthine dehydrogenase Mo-binding subunit